MAGRKRIRRDAREWEELVSRYEAGDLGHREFCVREGINENTFRMWRGRVGPGRQGGRFLEVVSGAGTRGLSWELELELPHGVVLRMRG